MGRTGAPDASRGGEDAGMSEVDDACRPPTHMIVRLLGSDSLFRVGWTGLGHGFSFASDSAVAVELRGCTADCTECLFRGPVDLPLEVGSAGPVNHHRCANDTSRACTADADCAASVGGSCEFYLGPSFAVDFDKNGEREACAQIQFKEIESDRDRAPIQGTVNLVDGQVSFSHFGLAIQQGTLCGQCEGDDMLFDGKRDGTCAHPPPPTGTDPAPRDGKACETHTVAAGGWFASYDCPAGPGVLGDIELDLGVSGLSTPGVEWTLTAASPACEQDPDKKCWCGECSNPPGQPCRDSGDCATGAVCGAAANSAPSGCLDTCVATDEDRGVGTCSTLFGQQSCFLGDGAEGSTMKALGRQDPFEGGRSQSRVATLACFSGAPDGEDGTIHQLLGFPAPSAIEAELELTLLGGDYSK
ncbi:MAG: hypothetical protein KC416_07325 [Myxococcales bacterium]|nr:hypothetical protein [Myxococcales bacterium]